MTVDRESSSTSSSVLPPGPSSQGSDAGDRSVPAANLDAPQPGGSRLWVRRISVLLFVVLCAVVGVLLVLLPWSLQWTANRFLWGYPDLRAALSSGFVRGICSGLGVVNLWIGFREAVHYHDGPGAPK